MIDRYKILETLGEGGAGAVHKAWDRKLQRNVAIKILLAPEARQAGAAGADLAAEAAALSALQHPNIVAVYDLDTDGPEPFVVMEHINGETLEATVRRGALLTEDFQQIASETLEGLIAAHKLGMCHRDLKPSNLMFHWLPDGKWQTKLLDFGLANFGLRPAQQELAGANAVAGSVHFMAPEQFLHQPVDVRTDLYSLGCVLYYSLTGSFPCSGATVEDVMNAHLSRQVAALQPLRPDVPVLLTDWVMWLMSRQPEERPESAADALRVLRGIQNGTLTSLPAQRALKTQMVPRHPAVVAAPLSKDVASRAAAGATTRVSRPADVPVPAPTVPSAGARPHTPDRPSAPPPKSKTPLLAGIAAVLVAGGAAAFFLTQNKGGGETDPAPADVPGGPPDKSLVIWFDAGKGARTDSGSVVAKPGDRVDQWDDRSPLAGNNPAQYHTTASKGDEKAARRPTLKRLTGSAGLKGTHDVMYFNGENCLVFARDRDNVGDPVSKEVSGSQMTWIAVFSADAIPEMQTLLCARVGRENRAWDTFVREGKVFSGVRKTGGAENHTSLPFAASAGYQILAVVWDGEHDRLRQWLTAPDGKTTVSAAVNGTTDYGDLADIRLGALTHTGASTDFLKGGIASLLLYNRALEDSEREAAVDYLSRRYFGVPAAKP